MSGLKLKGLRKAYGGFEVIRGVDLEIEPKEFVVFVGPSGCGKSTILRMIAGLEDISGGELFIGDRMVNDVDASKRGIAMVFQSYALYPHMTVEENMGFALKYAGESKETIKRQVAEAARILGLEALLSRRPKDLSGGQRQRVAIGRAIVRHPEVFLFDEPLSNLDAELRVQMRIEIARLHKELGTTIIYVTHDQVEAMTLADKIVVLRDGRIEQVGSPLDLYDNPKNQFVAGFIGSPKMNFLPAKIQGGRLSLVGYAGQSLPLPLLETAPLDGTEVMIGIRPEHFTKDGQAALELTVEIVENLGNETYAYARQGNAEMLTIAMQGDRSTRPGSTVSARFDPQKMFLFDTKGERIF
ncbi:sn-glycerol-3-phosphate ABC transporter ATP-binding protein UgpC [Marivivens sp. LCG002]|uniref:ABC transporter ATP-binding protein n=1 Tax=Marivivens sp. LCG002 TaxID=3051171 RepID=UPI002554E3A3|nr:sn-glycerol-3-phosphate ABC transporter ATP-binding protein UgpC [Marivivens sp. LCG002]WIV49505.1 sn-glycerol-3-phosphate ABC transporter ATP-binding protein UgpC [Marivivens sp. LCG002]